MPFSGREDAKKKIGDSPENDMILIIHGFPEFNLFFLLASSFLISSAKRKKESAGGTSVALQPASPRLFYLN